MRAVGSEAETEASEESTSAPPSPWRYAIDASMSGPRAVAVILETLLGAMEDNEPGVIGQHGEEFLHDYRVAVRRTRSALALFDRALDSSLRRRGKRLFGDLGRRTGAARDLDVLEIALPSYAEEAAREDAEGLARLSRRIARENEKRYAAIRRWLEGKTYRRAVLAWRADLEKLAATVEGEPMAEMAATAIRAAAERADRQIETIAAGDPEAFLHRLRIRFKKLRYALEFSTALTPGGEVEAVIATLKALQDRLGVHQDLVVHERWLAEYCGARQGADASLAAIGRRLAAVLRKRRESLRGSIVGDAARFRTELHTGIEQALEALARAAAPPSG